MNLGKNIKDLRRNRKITQEEFAEKINVSVQTVSRWENGTNIPDVQVLPMIAQFFEVSIDYLLGYGKVLSDKEWVEMYNKITELNQKGKNQDCLDYLSEMLKKYPDDTKVQLWYASMCRMVNKDKHLLADAINIYEKILRTTIDEGDKKQAKIGLFYTYQRLDDKPNMREVYNKYLKSSVGTDYYQMYFLEGHERIEYLQNRIEKSLSDIFNSIRQLRKGDYYTKEEKNTALKKYLKIIEIMYEKEDYGFSNWQMYDICTEIFMRCDRINNEEECLEYIEKATYYSIKFDQLPNNIKHESLLFNTLQWSTEQMTMNGYKEPGNMSNNLLNILQSDDFIKYSDKEIYIKCIKQLKEVALKY